MKKLPNRITIFNATPHTIRFWDEGWEEPIEIEVDKVISAQIVEREYGSAGASEDYLVLPATDKVTYVVTDFVGDGIGRQIALSAREAGADVVVGSIIAAQAYPGLVVAMTPAPGYERVPLAEKRMNPDKFVVFN